MDAVSLGLGAAAVAVRVLDGAMKGSSTLPDVDRTILMLSQDSRYLKPLQTRTENARATGPAFESNMTV